MVESVCLLSLQVIRASVFSMPWVIVVDGRQGFDFWLSLSLGVSR